MLSTRLFQVESEVLFCEVKDPLLSLRWRPEPEFKGTVLQTHSVRNAEINWELKGSQLAVDNPQVAACG
ncbi:hypothetical protein [Hahella ganghwensis]|uniref:hypothetical protein n=1 Tax=Hahella ganghwensis TaxID=286420 RepID=UPI00037CB093|nr:hypothetical protein [Hahella ganghwensis]